VGIAAMIYVQPIECAMTVRRYPAPEMRRSNDSRRHRR